MKKIIIGCYRFGKKLIYHMIPHAMRVLKIYILSKLEILKIRTTLGTLWLISIFQQHSDVPLKNIHLGKSLVKYMSWQFQWQYPNENQCRKVLRAKVLEDHWPTLSSKYMKGANSLCGYSAIWAFAWALVPNLLTIIAKLVHWLSTS